MSACTIRLIFFLNIPLDWERFGPLWEAAKERHDLEVTLIATRKFRSSCAGVIKSCGKVWDDKISYLGLGWLWKPDAILTVTESTARPHKHAHRMTKYVNFMGIPTITLQHGYECVGINHADKVHTDKIDIASRHILTWQPVDKLPLVFNRKIGERCVTAGYVAPKARPDTVEYIKSQLSVIANKRHPVIRQWVLVTENLHWHRYSDDYRHSFMKGLSMAAGTHSDIGFIVKHHPAGRFLENMSLQSLPDNIFLASDILSESYDVAPNIATWLACVDSLITTPSTTALDGALLNKPVIIVRNQLSGRWPYEPLYSIDSTDAWMTAIAMTINSPNELIDRSKLFITQNQIQLASPDAILEKITSIVRSDREEQGRDT